MITPIPSKQSTVRMFEAYDHKMGCVAVRHDEHWWVVRPNGLGTKVASEYEARTEAQCINLTATDEERESWQTNG